MKPSPLPVVTVTLNPAIDQTVVVDGMTLGEVHRASSVQSNAGGKGVNVASCLADWSVPVIATGILGGGNPGPFEALFSAKTIRDLFVRVPGETRTNIKIADPTRNETTDINLPGPVADDAALERVKAVLNETVSPDSLVVLAGSLPAGLPDETLARLSAALRGRGARVVLDTSGAPLKAALSAPAENLPFCVKPNQHELEEWAGKPLPRREDLLAAAAALQASGIAVVVVSLGAEGALFVTKDQVLKGRSEPVETLSTVGAGDAMVAGLVAAFRDDAPLEDVARLSIAFAAAKLGRIGPHLPDAEEVQRLARAVVVTELPAGRDLKQQA
ncbi:1-phosphofructokinase [Afifella marina]|uniref:Phosphofructokinase n=1 Tax=Afifella marina DSM 2698 TaxID=1120955 RepID=A0A1G5NUG3_AFIMA|nr:1-phosphofructokinase [Afifella marina]MBK1624085.1 1-phosphofructokinase [Afifella marina DSM 2698]MBK1627642.1 1-phosphofructokinase [Afifella marina]MBK5916366.1 1-phosphofructokinase [Afifella marina]RAI20926.1 1-phosphofructokinase [Afifella marina DSM 2698]SCZ40996.1 1-phosphofructokinase [Afifella marina DSM 2698]